MERNMSFKPPVHLHIYSINNLTNLSFIEVWTSEASKLFSTDLRIVLNPLKIYLCTKRIQNWQENFKTCGLYQCIDANRMFI